MGKLLRNVKYFNGNWKKINASIVWSFKTRSAQEVKENNNFESAQDSIRVPENNLGQTVYLI